MDLTKRLEQASHTFSREYEGLMNSPAGWDRNTEVKLSPEARREIPTLGIAVAIVDYFSRSNIEELVEKGIAHGSTYAGGSFPVARSVYTSYVGLLQSSENPVLKATADHMEQLQRTCKTAKNIVEKGLF